MKNITELENQLKQYSDISEKIIVSHPEIKSLDFGDIENVPLKIMIKFTEKHGLKPEYQTWQKKLRLSFYSFQNPFGKFTTHLFSPEVERTVPEPPPIDLLSYKEVKKVVKS